MKQIDLELIKLEARQYTSELYLETPTEWIPYIQSMVEEISILLSIYGYTLKNDFKFEQIKEKYDSLRVYYTFIPALRCDDDSESRRLKVIDDMISIVISKWEREVKYLIEDGRLPKQ